MGLTERQLRKIIDEEVKLFRERKLTESDLKSPTDDQTEVGAIAADEIHSVLESVKNEFVNRLQARVGNRKFNPSSESYTAIDRLTNSVDHHEQLHDFFFDALEALLKRKDR